MYSAKFNTHFELNFIAIFKAFAWQMRISFKIPTAKMHIKFHHERRTINENEEKGNKSEIVSPNFTTRHTTDGQTITHTPRVPQKDPNTASCSCCGVCEC